jgi:hypothetical protein
MSYGVSAALQMAVFQKLQADVALTTQVGGAIYDAIPAGVLPALYVSLGPEDVRDRSDQTGRGAEHDFTVSVVTEASGFQNAKTVAGTISDVLNQAPLVLTHGRLVSLNFVRAAARRVKDGSVRRIDLRFVARVEE